LGTSPSFVVLKAEKLACLFLQFVPFEIATVVFRAASATAFLFLEEVAEFVSFFLSHVKQARDIAVVFNTTPLVNVWIPWSQPAVQFGVAAVDDVNV